MPCRASSDCSRYVGISYSGPKAYLAACCRRICRCFRGASDLLALLASSYWNALAIPKSQLIDTKCCTAKSIEFMLLFDHPHSIALNDIFISLVNNLRSILQRLVNDVKISKT